MSPVPVVFDAPQVPVVNPPARIYVSGHTYKIVAPNIPHLPLANTIKTVFNWVGGLVTVAKNIMYILSPPASPTTDPGFLKAVANQIMTSWAGASSMSHITPDWKLMSVTCSDNGGGSSSTATSDHAAIGGLGTGNPVPPQSAVVVSWKIAASYRGGKPRSYIPGLQSQDLPTQGTAVISSTAATSIASAANAFLTSVNAATVTYLGTGYGLELGTISYQIHHAARPSPVFYPFLHGVVHERLDSQRRRSGKESLVGVTP